MRNKTNSSRIHRQLSYAYALCVGLFLGACSSGGWKRIPADDVRALLPRYALLSAALQNQSAPDSVRAEAYNSLFAEAGYSLVDWDSSMAWYAKNNMPLYYDFYRISNDSLTREVDRLQLRQDSLMRVEEWKNRRRNYLLDSVNLLSVGPVLSAGKELINQSFSIAPMPSYSGAELVLSTEIIGLPKAVGQKSPLTLYLQFSQSDSTVVSRSLRISKSGIYSLRLKTRGGISVARVQGFLQGVLPALEKGKSIFIDSLKLKKYPSVDSFEASTPTDTMPSPTLADGLGGVDF